MGSSVWSESVYLDAVAPDGALAFVARLGRYPSTRTAWAWAHVFTPDGCVEFVDDHYPCTSDVVAVEEPDATYAAGDVRFHRTGPRDAIARGDLSMRVGTLAIDATFTPRRVLQGAGNLPGRTEEHGSVSVRATWPRGGLALDALGQWHEQHQDTPRFTVPFTYLTVRGVDLSIVAIIGPKASGGIVRRDDVGARATAVRVGPRSATRELVVDLDDGSVLHGSLTTTYDYAVPINGTPRPGTIVTGTLDGHLVSGCVNDWVPPS